MAKLDVYFTMRYVTRADDSLTYPTQYQACIGSTSTIQTYHVSFYHRRAEIPHTYFSF